MVKRGNILFTTMFTKKAQGTQTTFYNALSAAFVPLVDKCFFLLALIYHLAIKQNISTFDCSNN